MPTRLTGAAACALALLTAGNLAAASEDGGLIFYERFLGNVSSLGDIFRLDTTLGYSFNKHFSVDGGLPVFFIRPSEAAASGGMPPTNGIGNLYAEFRLRFPTSVVNFSTSVTGTAPTGDKSRGLSTGRATVDWTNHFDRSFSRLTPFVNIGFANTVSDTPLFVRPYTTLGYVTHIEGGAVYRLLKFLDAGAGGYAIEPAGQQTVISELTTAPASVPAPSTGHHSGHGSSHSASQAAFQTTSVSVGSADLVRDDGVSLWCSVRTSKVFTVQVGYTRSIHYGLNALTFGIGANLGSVVRNIWSY